MLVIVEGVYNVSAHYVLLMFCCNQAAVDIATDTIQSSASSIIATQKTRFSVFNYPIVGNDRNVYFASVQLEMAAIREFTPFIDTFVRTVQLNILLRPNTTVEEHKNVRDQMRYNRVALQSPATMSCVINLVEFLGREHPGVCVIDELGIAFCKCLNPALSCVLTCRQPWKAKVTSVLQACAEHMMSTSPSSLSMAFTDTGCRHQ